jgi:glucokinase
MRLLAGDIGGTKTLLRFTDGASPVEERFDSTAYKTFEDLVREFLQRLGKPVDAACFAVAGPVYDRHSWLPNLSWDIDEESLQSALSIPHVSLVNDFYAVALGVPLLGEDDLIPLQKGERDTRAPVAILGAGTGLGEAMVIDGAIVTSEGGHADFAPQDEEQARLFVQLLAEYGGHVSWDRIVSGNGLVKIFTFLGGQCDDPAEVSKLAQEGDARAVRTFEIFADIYGAEAGNMALRVLARGGVYLAGGVTAKNAERLTDGRFMAAFRRKGRFSEFMEKIPVDLITNEQVGLLGAMEGARRAAR